MKKILARVHHALAWEVFTTPAAPWQRGFWLDRVGSGCLNIGIGARVLSVARLPAL